MTFIFLHSGFDFLSVNDTYCCYYNGTLVDKSIELAQNYPNILLEVSALHPFEPDGRPRNQGGTEVLRQIKEAGLANRTLWGSDANFPGVIKTSLEWIVPAMVDAGFTEEERCSALVSLSKQTFGIMDVPAPVDGPTMPPSAMPATTSAAGSCFGSILSLIVAVAMLATMQGALAS